MASSYCAVNIGINYRKYAAIVLFFHRNGIGCRRWSFLYGRPIIANNVGSYTQERTAGPESSGLSGKIQPENHPEYSGPHLPAADVMARDFIYLKFRL
ncbi:MAG TPA: hypothetical protein DCL77_13905 [Prolixibacteraceae bacterium]|nr:hypothetical protein [Prolixibacteraceae bacterium]